MDFKDWHGEIVKLTHITYRAGRYAAYAQEFDAGIKLFNEHRSVISRVIGDQLPTSGGYTFNPPLEVILHWSDDLNGFRIATVISAEGVAFDVTTGRAELTRNQKLSRKQWMSTDTDNRRRRAHAEHINRVCYALICDEGFPDDSFLLWVAICRVKAISNKQQEILEHMKRNEQSQRS